MKPKHPFLLLLLLLALASCQKEGSFETNQPGGGTPTSTKLNRLVYVYGANDSTVTELQYDAAGRFSGYNAPAGDILMNGNTSLNVVRNTNGIIQSYTVVNANDTVPTTTTYTVFYDAATRQYTHRIADIELNGVPLRDSTVFDYSSGRITATRFLIKEPLSGQSLEGSRFTFTYDALGNLSAMRLSVLDVDNGEITPGLDLLFQYDGKVNPLTLGAEGAVLDLTFFISPSNFTSVALQDLTTTDPAEEAFALAYTYRTDNRPEQAAGNLDGDAIEIRYRYN